MPTATATYLYPGQVVKAARARPGDDPDALYRVTKVNGSKVTVESTTGAGLVGPPAAFVAVEDPWPLEDKYLDIGTLVRWTSSEKEGPGLYIVIKDGPGLATYNLVVLGGDGRRYFRGVASSRLEVIDPKRVTVQDAAASSA